MANAVSAMEPVSTPMAPVVRASTTSSTTVAIQYQNNMRST